MKILLCNYICLKDVYFLQPVHPFMRLWRLGLLISWRKMATGNVSIWTSGNYSVRVIKLSILFFTTTQGISLWSQGSPYLAPKWIRRVITEYSWSLGFITSGADWRKLCCLTPCSGLELGVLKSLVVQCTLIMPACTLRKLSCFKKCFVTLTYHSCPGTQCLCCDERQYEAALQS